MPALLTTAMSIANNKRFQRMAIGFIIGGAVGFAIAKTAEPFMFQDVEYEMLPPYTTPDQAILMDEFRSADIPVKFKGETVGSVTSMTENGDGVTLTGVITKPGGIENISEGISFASRITGKQKYSRPVQAEAVRPTVQPLTGAEKLAALKEPAKEQLSSKKSPESTFSSTREPLPTITGGGNPHKKVNPAKAGE